MGLFNKENKEIKLSSPVMGTTLAITKAPDPTFSQEILGKGVAIDPSSGEVYAPCDATVDLMFDTAHAVNLIGKNGVELLIHVGIDTVKLKGKHFTAHVKNGDKVKMGDLLISFDKEKIEKEGYVTLIPIVVCNTPEYSSITPVTDKQVNKGDTIIILAK